MRLPTRVPEPALVRSVLVTITGVIAYLVGREVDTRWIETAMVLYGLASPFIAGLLIRPAVTPLTGRHARREPLG